MEQVVGLIIAAMNNKKKSAPKSAHNKPLDIKQHPINTESAEAKVAPEIVTDQQEITHTSGKEQGKKFVPTPPVEYQFKPGQSGNPGGRTPDLVKGIALRIAQLQAGKILSDKEQEKLRKLNIDTADITVLESIIVDWATSTNPIKQQLYVERVAGKVPNLNINAEINQNIVERFKSKLTDAELERIAAGEDAMEILFDKLPDIEDDNVIDVQAKDR